MKVIDKRQDNRTAFGNLNKGEAFFLDDCGDPNLLFMKIERMCGSDWNAICIFTGELEHFNSDDGVLPVFAEVTIKDR